MEQKRGVDYIGVSCVFWLHDGNGKILFSKRSQKCKDEQGAWECGGGSMEFGETFEQAVRREIFEEYGVEPLELEYLMTYNLLREHSCKKTHWVTNVFVARVDPKKVINGEPDKIDELGWFTFDNLPAPLHSAMSYEIPIMKRWLESKS